MRSQLLPKACACWPATGPHHGDSSGAAGSPGCANGCTSYPAQLTVDVTFTLNNQGRYAIRYKAHNDDAKLSTVVNLTNHSYFNLAGENSAAGSAYGQYVQLNANRYSPTDATQIPLPLASGVPVAGTPFDFRAPHTIGARIDDVSANDNVPVNDPRPEPHLQLNDSLRLRRVTRPKAANTPVPGGQASAGHRRAVVGCLR